MIGNVLVCKVVYSTKSMQTPMNYLITSVAVTDLIIALCALPRHALSLFFTHPKGDFGNYLCKFITGGGIIWVSNTTCGLILITIAFERYLAVLHPLVKKLRVSVGLIKRLVPFFCIFAVTITAPSAWVMEYNARKDFCTENWPNNTSPKAYVSFIFSVNCVIPILAMSVLYSCVILRLWFSGTQTVEISQSARYKARKKVTTTLAFVTVLHILCWAPNYVIYLTVYVGPGIAEYGSLLYNISVLLILLNSATNPICYCVLMENFRREIVRSILWWRSARVRSSSGLDSSRKNRNSQLLKKQQTNNSYTICAY